MKNKVSAKQLKEVQERVKKLRPFTPYISEQEHNELAALLASHGSSLARVDGAAFGLAVSLNAAPEAVVPLLNLETVLSPEQQERVNAYARAVWERVDREEAEDLSVNPELLTEVAGAEAWLTGLAWGVRVVPEKMALLAGDMGQAILGESATRITMTVMSFMEGEELERNPEALGTVQQIRQQLLGSMENVTPEVRAEMLQILLQDLFSGYSVINMLPEEVLTGPMQHGGFFRPPSTEPIRREGRKIRPNEACPCGSGKKYKKCHGAPGAPALPE